MNSKHHSDENAFGGVWSIKKLECVEGYLGAYLNVMLNQNWANLWYIDAFSGDGYQRLKPASSVNDDTLALFGYDEDQEHAVVGELVAGSATRAIRLSSKREAEGRRAFQHFVFLEYNEAKLEDLKNRVARDYPDQIGKCDFIVGDANETLPRLLAELDWQHDRAVTFIDPYATQLEWKAIQAFQGTCSDVWVLFPLFAIMRMLPREGMPSAGWSSKLDRLFGEGSWRELYRERQSDQLELFGDASASIERDRGISEVLDYATRRYATVFPEVCGPAILKTEKNNPLFALYAMVANTSRKARKLSRSISEDLIRKLQE